MQRYQKFQNSQIDATFEQPDLCVPGNGNSTPYEVNREMQPGSEAEPAPEDEEPKVEITIIRDEKQSENSAQFTDPAGDRFNPETNIQVAQMYLTRVMDHLAFRIFTLLMIILDVVLVLVDLASGGNSTAMEVISLVILTYFIVEVLVRIFSRPQEFFRNWIEVLDGIIVLISFCFAVATMVVVRHGNFNYARLLVAGRLIRIILIIRLFSERKHLQQATRHAVSQNKRRYQKDGFDLDLCYVTERVIAMSFPSTGLMALYRNPIKEVAKFLDTKHKDHYQVYNLCSERMYDESMFHCRVERIYIDDHNVPKLEDMVRYVKSVHEWLDADPSNVIAVHCKGGKGRTGTLICTWLVEAGLFEEAKDSLEYFGSRRTDKSVGNTFQGVETPSQSRYVGYFEVVKNRFAGELPPERKLKLLSIMVKNLEGVGQGDGRDFSCRVITEKIVYEYDFGKQSNCKVSTETESKSILADFADQPELGGDIKVMFHSTSDIPKGYDDCPFYFWFHTSFIEDNKLWLSREELDNPHKKKTRTIYKPGFGVQLQFTSADTE